MSYVFMQDGWIIFKSVSNGILFWGVENTIALGLIIIDDWTSHLLVFPCTVVIDSEGDDHYEK